jgi:hypothetical protein
MKSNKDAMIRHDDKKLGPYYGKGERDLMISDKANTKNNSQSKFNNTYFNEKYNIII